MTICGHCHGNKCEDNHVWFMVMETHSSPHPWFCAGRGVKVRATRGRPPSGWLHQLSPHQSLVPGARIGATQGARSPTGAYTGKGCGFWLVCCLPCCVGWEVGSWCTMVMRSKAKQPDVSFFGSQDQGSSLTCPAWRVFEIVGKVILCGETSTDWLSPLIISWIPDVARGTGLH